MLHAFKLYTGPDKASHVLEGAVAENDRTDVVAIHFKETPAHSSFDWHDAGIKYYPYHGIASALDDLEAGRIGLVIKLFPVISWLIKDRPKLTVAFQVPTHERLGIAFAKDNEGLCAAVNRALATLHDNGEFARLARRWFPG
jgi:ABC-type amino acid transport substrate-binding protein